MLNSKKKLQVRIPPEDRCCCFISATVLGMNDALVELTGALAGFTMALPSNQLICLAGLTTGIAATLSMGASEFLSQETEKNSRPYLAAFYTGVAYLITVALLLLPYFVLENRFLALGFCLCIAALIIMSFTRLVSRMRGTSYKHDCIQMMLISFSVAFLSFGISWLAKQLWGV